MRPSGAPWSSVRPDERGTVLVIGAHRDVANQIQHAADALGWRSVVEVASSTHDAIESLESATMIRAVVIDLATEEADAVARVVLHDRAHPPLVLIADPDTERLQTIQQTFGAQSVISRFDLSIEAAMTCLALCLDKALAHSLAATVAAALVELLEADPGDRDLAGHVLDDLMRAVDLQSLECRLSNDSGTELLTIYRGVRSIGPTEPVTVRSVREGFSGELRLQRSTPGSLAGSEDLLEALLDGLLHWVAEGRVVDADRLDPIAAGPGATDSTIIDLVSELDRAWRDRELEIRHQVIRAGDETVAGSEAQLFWPDPSRGASQRALAAPPLSSEVGLWFLRESLTTVERWIATGDVEPGHRLHIDLLGSQLADQAAGDVILETVERGILSAEQIAIEVTESALLHQRGASPLLRQLDEAGVLLFIDGFGGPGSNFTLLRSPLVDGVKLARSAIRGIATDTRQASIVTGLLKLSGELDIQVVATGIDRQEDLEWLHAHAAVQVQGDVVGIAMTEAALIARATDRNEDAA